MRKLFTDEKHIAAAEDASGIPLGDDRVRTIRRGLCRRRAQDRPNPRAHRPRAALVHRRLRRDRRATDSCPRQGAMAEPSVPGQRASGEAIAEALSSLVKAAMLDMDFAISVYLDTLDEQRRRAEAGARRRRARGRRWRSTPSPPGWRNWRAKDLDRRISTELPPAYPSIAVRLQRGDRTDRGGDAEPSATRRDAVHSGSREISTASDDLSRRTEQQAANLEETAAALGEISATVKKSAEGADHARQVVSAADDGAKKSAVVVRQAVEAMDAIAQIVAADRPDHRRHRRDRLPDQPAGAQCGRRSGAGGRGGPRLRGRRLRGARARAALRRSGQGDQGADLRSRPRRSIGASSWSPRPATRWGASRARSRRSTPSSPRSPAAPRSSRPRSPKSASRSPTSTRRPSRTPPWPSRRRRRAARFHRKPNG